MYAIDLDAFARPFIAESFAHLKNAPFRCGVRCYVGSTDKRNDRGNIDDFPRAILADEAPSKLLGRDKVSFQVDINYLSRKLGPSR